MLDAARIRSLPRLAAPLLTAYLDTNPATPRNQGSPPGYLAWLKARAQALDSRVPEAERPAFRGHIRRLERHLRGHPPRHRGVVAFSGPATWELLSLQVRVEDELHWGQPAVQQLFLLLDEHRPSGAVVVSRSGARFLRTWLGEVTGRPLPWIARPGGRSTWSGRRTRVSTNVAGCSATDSPGG